MTPIEALQAVYERGERCRDCEHRIGGLETERLSGRANVMIPWRGCEIIDSQNYRFAREAIECHGVENLLNQQEKENG